MRRAVLAAFLGLAAFAAPAHAELRVSMHDGLVTVTASEVTVRQILAEWARVGQTNIVNADGVSGGPVTLQITEMPEQQALDILLRSAAGYLAAPRPVPIATASYFDRIVITPTSSPSSSPISTPRPAPAQAQQLLQQAQQAIFRTNGPEQDDAPLPLPQQTPALAFPPPAAPPSAQPPAQVPTFSPSTPGGLSLPGTVNPAPPAGGQPGQAGLPGQPAPRPPAVER